jgi:hypothetical protein
MKTIFVLAGALFWAPVQPVHAHEILPDWREAEAALWSACAIQELDAVRQRRYFTGSAAIIQHNHFNKHRVAVEANRILDAHGEELPGQCPGLLAVNSRKIAGWCKYFFGRRSCR